MFPIVGAKPVTDLLDYVHAMMPLNSPGGLSRQQSADIVAFMLSKGNFKAGQRELTAPEGPPARTAAATARESASIPAGYYTREQAQRGKAAFNRNCAFCHSVDPKLYNAANRASAFPFTFAGPYLGRVYHGHMLYPTVYHLFRKLDSMPGYNTQAINAVTKTDIVAFLLEVNGLPSGPEELPPDPGVMKNMPLNEPGFQRLFNGKDFTGMHFVLGYGCVKQPEGCGKTDPGDVVRVEAGEIRCLCNIFGVIYWDRKYKDFTFRFEQKFERPPDWESDPLYFGGSGVHIFMQDPLKVYPKSLEIEGRYFDLGEPQPILGKATTTYDVEARLRAAHPLGQWEAVEIASKNGQVRVSVNGVLVGTVTQHDFPPGQIGMQIQGAALAWRNLRIKEE